jgi:hypothetical protein
MNTSREYIYFSFSLPDAPVEWNGSFLRSNPVQPECLPPGPVVAGEQKKARLCTSGGHPGYSIVQKPRCRSLPVTSKHNR